MNTERNCKTCKYYKDGYCENLELKPCYPHKGCDDFSKTVGKLISIDVFDKMKDEFISRYPKNYAGGLQMDGDSCVFSLNKILEIIDKYKAESESKK